MANENKQFGELINRDRADDIIQKRIKIMKRVNAFLIPMLEYPNQLLQDEGLTARPVNEQDDLPFFNNEYNGFVFSRTLIDELFAAKETVKGPLDSLAVIIAAEKDKDSEIMSPTVLVAACTSVPDDQGGFYLITPDGLTPAGETPPKTIVSKLPNSVRFLDNKNAGSKSLVFHVK